MAAKRIVKSLKRTVKKKTSGKVATAKKGGNPLSKTTKVTGKRRGAAQRAQQARQQKRRDTR